MYIGKIKGRSDVTLKNRFEALGFYKYAKSMGLKVSFVALNIRSFINSGLQFCSIANNKITFGDDLSLSGDLYRIDQDNTLVMV